MKKPLTPSSLTCHFERCHATPERNGWCANHAYAAQLLRTALHYGLPEHKGGALYIPGTLPGWEAYCEVVTPEHAAQVEDVLSGKVSVKKQRRVA